jgi:hypothetical protein
VKQSEKKIIGGFRCGVNIHASLLGNSVM